MYQHNPNLYMLLETRLSNDCLTRARYQFLVTLGFYAIEFHGLARGIIVI